MKKVFSLTFGLLILVAPVYALTPALPADTSSFRTMRFVEPKSVAQPTVVELKDVPSSYGYMIVNSDGYSVSIVQKRNAMFIAPLEVTACTSVCASAPTLADNTDSTFDFPLQSAGESKGKISIVYAEPLVTNSIVFDATRDSYLPKTFMLFIDGKRILNSASGNRVLFPEMSAKSIEVQFTYTQPIRFTEVGVGAAFKESQSIRFVYQPGETYTLYTDATAGIPVQPKPSIDLFQKTNFQSIKAITSAANPAFREPDVDNDGISDSRDNCPYVSNPDQKDGDSNGTGDMCDDYDFDGVATHRDNCPKDANADQQDTDRDAVGDVCDDVESRFTEKYPWLPWVVLGLVVLAIVYMGYDVVRNRKVASQ